MSIIFTNSTSCEVFRSKSLRGADLYSRFNKLIMSRLKEVHIDMYSKCRIHFIWTIRSTVAQPNNLERLMNLATNSRILWKCVSCFGIRRSEVSKIYSTSFSRVKLTSNSLPCIFAILLIPWLAENWVLILVTMSGWSERLISLDIFGTCPSLWSLLNF